MLLMYHQKKEEKIKEDVLDAIRQLQARNQRITIKAICQIVQVSPSWITRYPQVNKILDPLLKTRQKALLRRYS